jgi:hypothetical protein
VRTTDDIIHDLQVRAAAGEDVRQQVISHETIARLRTELTTFDHSADPDRANGLQMQINTHLGLVDEDVDDRIAERPDKDSVDEVEDLEKAKRPRPAK